MICQRLAAGVSRTAIHTIASFNASLTVISFGAHICDELAKVLLRRAADREAVERNAGRKAELEDCREAERRRDAGRTKLAMAAFAHDREERNWVWVGAERNRPACRVVLGEISVLLLDLGEAIKCPEARALCPKGSPNPKNILQHNRKCAGPDSYYSFISPVLLYYVYDGPLPINKKCNL